MGRESVPEVDGKRVRKGSRWRRENVGEVDGERERARTDGEEIAGDGLLSLSLSISLSFSLSRFISLSLL